MNRSFSPHRLGLRSLRPRLGAKTQLRTATGDRIKFVEHDVRMKWWTRSQRIRTFGEIPFEVALLEAEERPVYQRIAEEALRLQRLG
jgi:hypothetical protein